MFRQLKNFFTLMFSGVDDADIVHPLTPVEMMEEWETKHPSTPDSVMNVKKAVKAMEGNKPIPETYTLVAIDNDTERVVANFGTQLPKGDINKHLPHLNCRIELLTVNQYNYIMLLGDKKVDKVDLEHAYKNYNNYEGIND